MENIRECSRKTQAECHQANTSICESEKAIPCRGSCQKCNQRFSNMFQYKYHMKTMHQEQPFKLNKCMICLYEFVNNSALVSHMRLHTGEKPFACETCGKKFAFKVALVMHYCINGDQPYTRKVTPTAVQVKTCIAPKKKKTATAKPKVCDICNAQFTSYTSLRKHKIKHTGLKPFPCKRCPKQFRYKTALDSHACINGDKPYMVKTENNDVQATVDPIDNIETVKVERIESETEIEEGDMIEIKIERDELELGDKGVAEIKIKAIKTEIKEEY